MVNTVVLEPYSGSMPITDQFIIHLADIAESIPRWGTRVIERDRILRAFFVSEDILMSALYSTISKYTAFGWSIKGYPRTAQRVQSILHNSEHSDGWIPFMQKQLLDIFTQDNGAHMELVRTDNDPRAPVVQINHLDSARCFRTGQRDKPIIYVDVQGRQHELTWYQVISSTEFPSANEDMRGYQYCAVTRILGAAQYIKNIHKYQDEKVQGRNPNAVHLVSGVSTKQVREALGVQQEDADARSISRYVGPTIIGSIDPTANVSSTTLEMASLPDGFDEETAMRWYINHLALTFGADYQDFAPLPGGNLGSAHQAEVLHLKSRGKGPALFMRMYEQKFNFHGVMPNTVTFSFGEQDVALDSELQDLRYKRAQTLTLLVKEGVLTPEVARQIMMDNGDLDEKYLELFGESNATPTIVVGSSKTSGTKVVKSLIRDATGRASYVLEELV